MYKAALILQGGGLRGAYTSGVLDVLMENDIYLEATFGISAGAKNAQYYISHQIGEAIKVDLHCIKEKKAISVHNLFFAGGMISADYYNNYVMKELAPLNDYFYKSDQLFYIGATNCLTGNITYFDKSEKTLRAAVTASCSIPLVQSMVYIDNIPYLDGGVAENIPLHSATSAGYKKRVVVLTRERGFIQEEDSARLKRIYKIKYRKYPNLVNKILSQNIRYNNLFREIEDLEAKGEIFCIYPSIKPNIRILEKDENKIKELYELGRNDALKSIENLKKYLDN